MNTDEASILIIDDEKNIRRTLQQFLETAGYRVKTAADDVGARKHLDQQPFDVIICDVILPGTDGLTLLEIFRAVDPNTQVIIITGEPDVDSAAEALRLGATDYLSKPVDKATILRGVANALRIKMLERERQRLEEDNRRHREDLEDLVQERTAALKKAMDELRNTHRKVVKQERMIALGQMVSGITHDINNALMPIMGTSDLLLCNPDLLANRNTVKQSLQTILSAAHHAREIIRRLREFYRPTDPANTEAVNLQDLAQAVISLSEPSWKVEAVTKGKQIQIQTKLAAEPLIVCGNTSDLREMLINLVLNAVDAIQTEGFIRLHIMRNDNHAVIRLSDTGSGMPDEVREHCFEPFYSTKGSQGSGLGLSVCHGVVQRHGGKISVKSHPDTGTTFTIILPLSTIPPSPPPSDGTDKHHAPPVQTAPLRILVVDDDAPSRVLLTHYLQKAGHTVTSADNGQTALETLHTSDFDLLLTDRAMPEIGGDELARKAREAIPSIRTIMLTGFADLMAYQNDVPTGIDAVLSKPITARELLRKINQLIHGAG